MHKIKQASLFSHIILYCCSRVLCKVILCLHTLLTYMLIVELYTLPCYTNDTDMFPSDFLVFLEADKKVWSLRKKEEEKCLFVAVYFPWLGSDGEKLLTLFWLRCAEKPFGKKPQKWEKSFPALSCTLFCSGACLVSFLKKRRRRDYWVLQSQEMIALQLLMQS